MALFARHEKNNTASRMYSEYCAAVSLASSKRPWGDDLASMFGVKKEEGEEKLQGELLTGMLELQSKPNVNVAQGYKSTKQQQHLSQDPATCAGYIMKESRIRKGHKFTCGLNSKQQETK
jgi:hypothetical protein